MASLSIVLLEFVLVFVFQLRDNDLSNYYGHSPAISSTDENTFPIWEIEALPT